MAERVPDTVREAVWARDLGRCARCGGPGQEFAHRRTRAVGGEHRHCPCNAWLACSTCHRWQHANPEKYLALGIAVSRYVEEPSTVPITTWLGELMLHCDGSMSWT